MADYRKMYYIICGAASKAIDAPPQEAKRLLQTALYEAEDIYISAPAGKVKHKGKRNRVRRYKRASRSDGFQKLR